LKKQFGVKTKLEEANIEETLEERTNVGRRQSKRKIRKEQQVKDNLVEIIEQRN